MTVDQVDRMYKEMCLLGPMAAVFGREVQQTLMSPNPPNKIPVEDFQYSVNSGRASLSQQRVANARIEPADDQRDDDGGSQTSMRTRSPRKMPYHGAIWEQPPVDVRESHDDRRPMYSDIRQRPDNRQVRDRCSERRPIDLRAHSGYPREGDSERDRR